MSDDEDGGGSGSGGPVAVPVDTLDNITGSSGDGRLGPGSELPVLLETPKRANEPKRSGASSLSRPIPVLMPASPLVRALSSSPPPPMPARFVSLFCFFPLSSFVC